MSELIIRVISLCIALASAETLHGIFRAAILVPRIGKQKALKVSIVTGSALALTICYFLVPPMNLTDPFHLLGIGLIISLFMASFDITLSTLLLKRSWSKTLADFDPRTGNYLLYGLTLMIAYPYLVMSWY